MKKLSKCRITWQNFVNVEEKVQHDRKFDIEFQKKLENVAFKKCAVNHF